MGTDDPPAELNRQLTHDPAFARKLLESVLQAVPDVGRDEEVREIALAMVRASLESFADASSTTCPESEIVEVEYARLLTYAAARHAPPAPTRCSSRGFDGEAQDDRDREERRPGEDADDHRRHRAG